MKSVPTVEIRIPISANEKFLRMTRYLLESIRIFGGPLARSAHCVVSVSRDEPYRDLYKECAWHKDYSVEFQWLDEKLFDELGYHGTGFHRYIVDSDADIIILCDADILITGNLDQVILRAFQTQKELGFIAHVSPFNQAELKDVSNFLCWKSMYDNAGLNMPTLDQKYTGFGFMGALGNKDQMYCPYYFNYGFIVTPRAYVEKTASTLVSELQNLASISDNIFNSQIAMTLSYTRHNIPCETLPLNYNFPLHVPEELIRRNNLNVSGKNSAHDIKIFHYLGKGDFHKDDFATEERLNHALDREPSMQSRKEFIKKLKHVHQSISDRPTNPEDAYKDNNSGRVVRRLRDRLKNFFDRK